MKRIKSLSFLWVVLVTLFLLISNLSSAQIVAYTYQIVYRTSVTGTKSANITGSGAAFHQLTWNGLGTITGCSVKVDSSANGTVWNDGDVIAAQDCSTNGQILSSSIVPNYVRINVTTLTGTGESLAVNLSGYINNPVPAGTLSFSAITSGTNTSAAMVVGTGASLGTSGSGTITATAIPWSGVTSTPTTISGYGITNAIITNPSGIQTITESAADGAHWEQTPCTSLSSSITTQNAGCAASYQNWVVKSTGTTQNNLRHTANFYFETNAQQGNVMYGVQINAAEIQDANTSATNNSLTGLDVNAGASGNVQTIAKLYGLDSRPRVYTSGTHVAELVFYHGAGVGVVPTGVTVDVARGVSINLVNSGTVTASTGYSLDTDAFQYGMTISGSLRAGYLSDATSAKSGLCHGTYTSALVVTEHDCWLNGSGSPEGVVTANISSFYARLDGGAGTALYIKRSGISNTGWVALNAVFPTTLTTTAATSDNLTVTGMLSGGHCSLTPTNTLAATDLGAGTAYISAKTTDQITVTHAVVASETFDVLCVAN